MDNFVPLSARGVYFIVIFAFTVDQDTNDLADHSLVVYGSNDNATWTEIADFTNGVPERTEYTISHEGYYQYIRFEGYDVPNGGSPVIYEIELYGTIEPTGPVIGNNLVSGGASIRLPDESIVAGMRFRATITKSFIDEYESMTYGMFMLPASLLSEGQTLASYLAANSYEGEALKIPAVNIWEETDTAITYTAVLTSIPATAYTQDIVAVPYVCADGEYAFGTEMTRNYKQVADATAAAYEAGNLQLTATQKSLLEAVVGRTLTASAA